MVTTSSTLRTSTSTCWPDAHDAPGSEHLPTTSLLVSCTSRCPTTPHRCSLLHRNPLPASLHLRLPLRLITDTPSALVKFHLWTLGNRMSTFMTRANQWLGFPYGDPVEQAHSTKTLRAWLYQGLHNNWIRQIAHGCETYVIPFDNICTTVFVAELVSQLRSRNIDLDRLAAYRSRNQGTNLSRKRQPNGWPRISPSRSDLGFHPLRWPI